MSTSTPAPGFWTEAGGHTCYNSYGNLLSILDDLGLIPLLRPKQKVPFRLWRDGERQSIFSALHPLELVAALPRLWRSSREGKGLAEYYGGTFGPKNYRDLFGPAFRAVVCQPPDDFPAELLFRKKPRRKGVPKSFTLPDGLGQMAQAIADQDGLDVRLNQQVSGVRQVGAGFRISLSGGDEIVCDALTLAVPPDAAAALIPAGLPEAGPGDWARHGGDRDPGPGGARPRPAQPPAAPGGADRGGRCLLFRGIPRLCPGSVVAGLCLPLPPRGPGPCRPAHAPAAPWGWAPSGWPEVAQVTNRLPALRKGHAALVAKLDEALAGTRLGITGNWFIGVSIEDCLTRSRQEVDRLFGTRRYPGRAARRLTPTV